MSVGRGQAGLEAARPMIGRRVCFAGDPHTGVITDVTLISNGYVRYVVQWAEGAPAWWTTLVNPSAGGLVVLEPERG